MKTIKYLLLAGLVCASSAFAYSTTSVNNVSNVCIWLTPGGTGDALKKPDYPFGPGLYPAPNPNMLLSRCAGKTSCTSSIQYSAVAKDGSCTYKLADLHLLKSTVTWSGISSDLSSYTEIDVKNQGDALKFTPGGQILTVSGQEQE